MERRSPCLICAIKARAYPFSGMAPSHTGVYKTSLVRLTLYKRSSLFYPFDFDEEKNYNIEMSML